MHIPESLTLNPKSETTTSFVLRACLQAFLAIFLPLRVVSFYRLLIRRKRTHDALAKTASDPVNNERESDSPRPLHGPAVAGW